MATRHGENDATWRELFESERESIKDSTPVVAVAPDEDVLDVGFYSGYGGTDGPDFLIWTERYVYFPVCYDGAEWVGSAPRNPVPEGQAHVGGG